MAEAEVCAGLEAVACTEVSITTTEELIGSVVMLDGGVKVDVERIVTGTVTVVVVTETAGHWLVSL